MATAPKLQPREFSFEDATFSVAEAAAQIRVSTAFFYGLIAAGKIHKSKIGRRSIITGRELRRYLDSLS